MLEENAILQGRYQIVRQIGQGGMGAVYLAKDLRLGNTVALKESFFTDAEMVQAFEREARLLAGLRHPALPKVFDHFAEDDRKFLIMEFIGGDDLSSVLEKRRLKLEPFGTPKPFEVAEVLDWAEQLLDALDYLHSRSSPILHRDIKPQNLKLAERNQITLLDFGLAKGALLQTTRMMPQQSIRGYTPSYAPIEQIQGAGTDPRSDLYSLAATLYHLLTGREPPDAVTRANAILGAERDPLYPAHELNPKVPLALSAVLDKAMALHCNARPATAKELLQLLREARRATVLTGDRSGATQAVVAPSPQQTLPVQTAPPSSPSASQPSSSPPASPYPASSPSPPTAAPFYHSGGATVPNPEAGATQLSSSAHTHVTATPAASRAKLWIGVVAAVVVLASLATAAILYIQNRQPSLPPPPVNQNRQSLPPPLANTNTTQNTNTPPAAPVIPDAIKAVIAAENFVAIKTGEFMMGANEFGDATTIEHLVKISRPFEMGKYEVTQKHWEAVMGGNPSKFKGANLPVENVSWADAQAFIAKLNALGDGYLYRLPTEAEWEYACRAGGKASYQANLDAVAWYGNNSGLKQLNATDAWQNNRENYNKILIENDCQPHRVGSKKPNAWGLYDMQGNVWEWCQDWYGENYYLDSPDKDPPGPASGTQRVNRGGSWYSQIERCQSTSRSKDSPDAKLFNLGLRLVRVKNNKTS